MFPDLAYDCERTYDDRSFTQNAGMSLITIKVISKFSVCQSLKNSLYRLLSLLNRSLLSLSGRTLTLCKSNEIPANKRRRIDSLFTIVTHFPSIYGVSTPSPTFKKNNPSLKISFWDWFIVIDMRHNNFSYRYAYIIY